MTTRTLPETRLWLGAPWVFLLLAAACSPAERNFGAGGGGAGAASSSGSGQGGACSDTTSVTNCGACGHDCTKLPNVDPSAIGCVAGACFVPPNACTMGFAHCSQNPDDGCEANVVNDNVNCGACGSKCFLGQLCGASKCTENQVSCVLTGTCAQAFCNDLGHYSVTKEIVVDLQKARTLWQRNASTTTMDFATATAYCGQLSLEGITGWRVPSTTELSSITYKAGGLNGCPANYCNPSIDQAAFGNTVSDEYWTLTVYMAGINFCVSFCDGRSTPWKEDVATLHYVRCVHDPVDPSP